MTALFPGRRSAPLTFTLAAALALAACGNEAPESGAEMEPAGGGPETLLYVWLYDADAKDPDFLAVIDADTASSDYGTILTTVPAGEARGNAHHTPIYLPESGILFANDFAGDHTFIYDTSKPLAPVLTGSFGHIGEYSFAHSFSELPNGNILATFQSKGDGDSVAGGLVELTTAGEAVQTGDADPGDENIYLRPYGIVLLPDQDRVVTTTFDMRSLGQASHIQVWRLSDLTLLFTLKVPTPEGKDINIDPFEGRVLADGETIMFETLSCGLYVLTGTAGPAPEIGNVHDFGGQFCGLPVRLGHYWVQSVESDAPEGLNALVSLDISDPMNPVEAGRITFPDGFGPHWTSPDATGTRIVVNGYYDHLSRRILMVNLDPATGAVSLDADFGGGDEFGPGVMIDRRYWPHGESGAAIAHGAVFWPPATPDWKR